MASDVLHTYTLNLGLGVVAKAEAMHPIFLILLNGIHSRKDKIIKEIQSQSPPLDVIAIDPPPLDPPPLSVFFFCLVVRLIFFLLLVRNLFKKSTD